MIRNPNPTPTFSRPFMVVVKLAADEFAVEPNGARLNTTFFKMDIPIAVAVGAEPPDLAQELAAAEEDLQRLLSLSSDFFASKEERDSTYAHIQQNLDASYEKPFMKKIALAYAKVSKCKEAATFAPLGEVKQMMEQQRVTFDLELKDLREELNRLRDGHLLFKKHAQQLLDRQSVLIEKQRVELEEKISTEQRYRKAFQAKVKDSYEEIMFTIIYTNGEGTVPNLGFHEHMKRVLGIKQDPTQWDVHGMRNFFIYKRFNCPTDYPSTRSYPIHPEENKKAVEIWEKQTAALAQFKFTHFDGTDP